MHMGPKLHYDGPFAQDLVKDAEALIITVDSFFKKATKLNENGTRETGKFSWVIYARTAKKLPEKFKAF